MNVLHNSFLINSTKDSFLVNFMKNKLFIVYNKFLNIYKKGSSHYNNSLLSKADNKVEKINYPQPNLFKLLIYKQDKKVHVFEDSKIVSKIINMSAAPIKKLVVSVQSSNILHVVKRNINKNLIIFLIFLFLSAFSIEIIKYLVL